MTPFVGIASLSDDGVTALWFHAAAELHRRGVKLWHAGDLAEVLVAAAIGGTRASSRVQPGYDVLAADGQTRWQVKALLNRRGNTRTSVGFLRPGTYDVLAIVRLAEDMRAVEAWQVPSDVIPEYARWDENRGRFRLMLTQKLISDPRVRALSLTLPLVVEKLETQ